MKKDETKRDNVAIYTRVSTEDQAKEGFSLDAQIERLRNYCEARGWSIYKEYIDDGYSGRDIKRPAYTAMMQEMESWDILLVMKMDRIHRNSRNFMEMMDLLRKHNKEFVSMTESLDTSTAMGRFVVDIIQRIAQLESEQIGERVFYGMQQKAQTPHERLDPNRSPYLGFGHPYGYDYRDNKLIVNETEAPIVKKIYNLYIGGWGLGKIVNYLKKNKCSTKRGGVWDKRKVSNMLKNPVYCGLIDWNGIIKQGKHEAIIDKNTFLKAQNALGSRSGKPYKLVEEGLIV